MQRSWCGGQSRVSGLEEERVYNRLSLGRLKLQIKDKCCAFVLTHFPSLESPQPPEIADALTYGDKSSAGFVLGFWL